MMDVFGLIFIFWESKLKNQNEKIETKSLLARS